MKKIFYILFALILTGNMSACGTNEDNTNPPTEQPGNFENMKLKITIGNNILTATLADNPTARDFVTLLPVTVKLDDYNSTEKIFYPERKLSTQDAPSSINPVTGDITYYSPWGNIAIFYKDFRQSSGLIRIAEIDSGISALQVSGSINDVRFELIEIQE